VENRRKTPAKARLLGKNVRESLGFWWE